MWINSLGEWKNELLGGNVIGFPGNTGTHLRLMIANWIRPGNCLSTNAEQDTWVYLVWVLPDEHHGKRGKEIAVCATVSHVTLSVPVPASGESWAGWRQADPLLLGCGRRLTVGEAGVPSPPFTSPAPLPYQEPQDSHLFCCPVGTRCLLRWGREGICPLDTPASFHRLLP